MKLRLHRLPSLCPRPRFCGLVALNRRDRITDQRALFYQRLQEHRDTLPPSDGLDEIHGVRPAADPGRSCLRLGLLGIGILIAIPLYFLFYR